MGNLPPTRADLSGGPADVAPQPAAAGAGRWLVAVLSLIAVVMLSLVVAFEPNENPPWKAHRGGAADPSAAAEPDPAEILVRQLRAMPRGDARRAYMLHTSAGHIFRDRGRYSQASKHYQEALRLASDSDERISAQRDLGVVETELGHLAPARDVLEAALVALSAAASPQGGSSPQGSSEGGAGVLHALGDVRMEMGHLGEALQIYKQAFDAAVERRDADEVVLLAAELGEAEARSGHLEKAFAWLRRATDELAAARRAAPGADGVVAAKVNSYLGSAYHMQGNVSKAMDLYRRAMRAQADALRPTHPDLLATRLGLARALRDAGSGEEALRAVEAVEATLRAGPGEGPDLSRALILKSDVLREANRTADAEASIEEALRLQVASFGGANHPEVAVAFSSLGSILHDTGRLAQAHNKYKQALRINLDTVGEMHLETASAYNSLGTLFQDTGDDAAAQQHFSKCLDIQLATIGESNPDVANTYNNLATVLYRQGKAEDALGLLRKAVGLLDAAGVPGTSPDRAVYEDNIHEILSAEASATPKVFSA